MSTQLDLRRLSPLRRAFWLGYRAGLNKAQAKMRSRAQQWEDEIQMLQDDYRALLNEMRCAANEQVIKDALDERVMHPDAWLN